MKDTEKFNNAQDEVCYIPHNAEDENDHYSARKIVLLCKTAMNDSSILKQRYGTAEEMAKDVFDIIEWQFPDTVIEEIKEDINN